MPSASGWFMVRKCTGGSGWKAGAVTLRPALLPATREETRERHKCIRMSKNAGVGLKPFALGLAVGAAMVIDAVLAGGSAQAAAITWGAATTIAGDSDVATDGVLQYAEHWAGVDGTVNGVAFTAAQNHVVGTPASGYETLNDNNGYPQGSLSTAYWNILRGKWYHAVGSVTLNSLQPGHQYLTQIWSSDPRYSSTQVETISGGPSLGMKAGRYAIGAFTADAATQVFSVGGDGVLNAVVVRDISGVTVGLVNAGTSTVVASPASVPADGATAATITVTLKDANGNRVAGKTVTLVSSRGGADTISAASGVSSAAGIVTFTVQSTTTGTAVFSATDSTDNLAITETATVLVLTVGAQGPQASPNPIVFDQTATNDNLVVLMAAASEYSSGLTLLYDGPSVYPKHFWFNNWSHGTNDYMKWNVALATGAVYHVYAKLSAGANVPLRLSIAGTNTVLNFTTRNSGWDKLDAGTISFPSGTSQLVLRRNTTNTTDALSIISLELIRESDRAAYHQRVASFRADTTWLSQSKYGLMTQFGAWGYPPTGPNESLAAFANGFDVPKFVNLVTNTGSKYVLFSLTWYTYQMCAPIQSVNSIVGNPNRTSTRDVIGELAAALHAAGVRFMLYYHCGQDSQWGYNSTDWWQAQQFPEPEHTERGTGDRSLFFTNWCNVITEIGNRYGTNLDGWFFDDGMVYYPAPFERLGQAAKAGNPNRLVCYNAWIATSYTDFQEVWMGEGSHGESQFGSTAAGGSGVFTDGPQQGLLQHGMFIMEQDWGVYQQNQPITTQISSSQAIAWVQSASARGVPLSFNMMMWSDQTYSAASLNVLLNLKKAIYGGGASGPTNNLVVNGGFENPTISYYTSFPAGSANLPGWTVDSTPPDGLQLGTAGLFSNNGSQNLQLTGGSTYSVGGGISQTIATTPGASYSISIDVASREGVPTAGNFNFGGTNIALSANSTTFATLTWQIVATASNTVIDITGDPNSDREQLIIDNVLVVPILLVAPSILDLAVFPGGSFHLTFSGPSGQPFRVRATNNLARAPLASWPVVMAGTFGVGGPISTNFIDFGPATNQQRFYRIVSP